MTVVFMIIVVLTASHCCHRLIYQCLLNPGEYDSCHHYHPDHEVGATVAKAKDAEIYESGRIRGHSLLPPN